MMLAKKGKKLLALLLALIMVLSLLPMTVFAAGGGSQWQLGNYAGYNAQTGEVNGDSYETAAAATQTLEEDGITMQKNISATGTENLFDIELIVTTQEQLAEVPLSPDAAVVLVIDASNSMNYNDDGCGRSCWEYGHNSRYHEGTSYDGAWPIATETRLPKAKTAAVNFVDDFVEGAGEASRMISVVSFNGSATEAIGWSEANVALNPINNNWWSPDIADVKDAIYGIQTGSDTNIEDGLQKAYDLLGESKVAGIKSRYVILLTDGAPTTCNSNGYWHSVQSCAENAAEVAEDIRVDRQALLYTLAYSVADTELYGGEVTYEKEERTCTQTGWHRHDREDRRENGYGSGKTGTFQNGNFKKCEHFMFCGCTSGWFNGSHTGTVSVKVEGEGVTVGEWLEKDIASDGCSYNANNGDEISISLKDIVETISKLMQAWQVRDPMGDYMKNPTITGSYGKDVVSVANDGTITWNLWLDKPTASGSTPKTYTYKLTYTVELDTAKQGFAEDVYYETNQPTTLTYAVDLLDNDGNLNVNADVQTAYFNIPTVCGTIPEYAYRVEYYLQDKSNPGTYVLKDTEQGEETDLHTSVTILEDGKVPTKITNKYSGQNYHFKEADPASITISANEQHNVIKVYYDADTTSATVNHYYKTTTIHADGTTTVGKYKTEPDTTVPADGYVGDEFKADLELTFGSAVYELDAEESDEQEIILSKDPENNVIDLYYERTVDERADASVVVDHVYRTHTWTLVNGEYKLLDTETTEKAVETANNLKATTVYTASTSPKDGYEDFTYDATSTNSVVLAAGENRITLYFDKTVDNREPISITVKHNYTKTVVTIDENGVPQPETKLGTETETVNAYKGETVTLNEQNSYQDETYVSDSGNAAKLTVTNAQSGETVNLYYTLYQSPATTSVTVNHIYRTITHETVTVVDPETGEVTGTDTEDFVNEDGRVPTTVELLYVGQTYNAEVAGRDGYVFNEKESDPQTVTVQADGTTVINLYYDKDVETDNREEATIDVKHVYTTHLTTIVNGKVDTVDTIVEDMDEKTVGQAGDHFTAIPKTERDGETYTTTTSDAELSVILQSGTNSTIVIEYERFVNDLKETTYSVNYVYNTYTMTVNEDGVAGYYTAPAVENVSGKTDVSGYVGEIVTIESGVKDGFTADAANPAETQTLEESGNVYTYVYNKYEPLAPVTVTVNHHYTTTTIAENGTSTVTTDSPDGTTETKYMGETYVAEADAKGYTYDRYTVTMGIAADQDETTKNVTVTASSNVVIDFYYSKTVDNSKPVNYSIQHIYVTTDWNGSTTTSSATPLTGQGYATGQISAATSILSGFTLTSATFNGGTIEGFDADDPQDAYAITLVEGENVIVYTYERTVDTREDTKVQVTHNYYARDTYTDNDDLTDDAYIAQDGITAEYTVVKTVEGKEDDVWVVWVGGAFTATQEPTFTKGEGDDAETLTYVFVNADPEGGKIDVLKAMDGDEIPNQIVMNYIRTYSTDPGDATYTIVHQYYTNGSLTGTVESGLIAGKLGDVVNAADLTKQTTYNNNSYNYTSADKDALTLTADGENVITLRYDRTTGGGGTVTPTDPTPVEPTDPTDPPEEEIEDEDPPLADLPEEGTEIEDEEPPLADLPEETIDNEEPPMADAPKTGDNLGLWMTTASLSGLGLVALGVNQITTGRKKKDENQ